jgi:hypothetical protein
LPLPANYRVRLDDEESISPVAPGAAEEHPEYPIARSQSGAAVPPLENSQLLAQGEVLGH